MLTDEEKSRIRHEESYRQEIRAALSPQKAESRSQKFLKLLNSPFTLWLLSSVVLTAVTAFVASYIENQKTERERSQLIHKLTIEATYRIKRLDSYTCYRLADLETAEAWKERNEIPAFVIVGIYDQFHSIDTEGLFKELSDRSLRSILWELIYLRAENSTERRDAEAALNAALSLYAEYEVEDKQRVEEVRKDKDVSWVKDLVVDKLNKFRNEILPKLNQLSKANDDQAVKDSTSIKQ